MKDWKSFPPTDKSVNFGEKKRFFRDPRRNSPECGVEAFLFARAAVDNRGCENGWETTQDMAGKTRRGQRPAKGHHGERGGGEALGWQDDCHRGAAGN